MRPSFVLGADVHENVAALRVALGSISRPLSFAGLAEIVGVGATSIQRWEKDGAEPDIRSMRRMAELAGVTFEQFAVGNGTAPSIQLPDPAKDRKLTEQEEERAVRKAERAQRGRAKPVGKKRSGGRGRA